MNKSLSRAALTGVTGALVLLAAYFSVVSFISGWPSARDQFFQYWYFLVSLSVGFGVQLGSYFYLKQLAGRKHGSGKVVAVSGTTSTAAMVSCCAHYLVNILPVLGVTGVLTVISGYQVQFFWVGLGFNVFGIYYVANRIRRYAHEPV